MNPTAIQFYFQTDHPKIRFVQGTNVNHSFPCHIHNSFSLGIIQKGQRVIRVDGKPYILSANECFIINPNQPHSIEGKGAHNYRVASLSPKLVQNIFREITGEDRVPYFPRVRITDSSIINGLAVWQRKQFEGKPINTGDLVGLLRELVLRYVDAETPARPKQIKHPSVVLACEYIETNLDRPVRLDEIADTVRISPFYLNRIFREGIGIPPYTYLVQTRIKKSLELLLQTNSISEATHYLGFADQSHFSRFFKRNIGITPGQYLDLHKSGTH